MGIFGSRVLPAEGLARFVVVARGEEAVGQRLREHVGELLNRQIRDQHFLEGVVQAAKCVGCLIQLHRLDGHVADHVRQPRHTLRQIAGLRDRRWSMPQEYMEQFADRVNLGLIYDKATVLYRRQPFGAA